MVATAVILNGGGNTSTTATVVTPTPRTMISTPHPTPGTSLSPETITTLPPPSARPTTPGSTQPSELAPTPASPSTVPPAPTLDPNTVFYQVTGTKQLLDLVTIVYTDAQGLPQTDLNVSLPWTKMIVLNPGVQLTSVVATSLGGRLNCTITNAAGQTIVASTSSTIIATCTH